MSPEPFLWSDLGAALARARIAARLAAARSTSEIAALLLGDVRTALGADSAVVAVPSDDARQLVVASEGVPEAVTSAISTLSGAEPFPIVQAYRCGEPLFAESAAAVASSFPPLGLPTDAGAMACLPLRTPAGAAGAVGFGYRGPRRFGPADRAALDDLSRDVAAAMERARLRETERAARRRLVVLAEASALLLENAADLPALLDTVTRLVQQATGDPCFVQVLGDDGGLASGPTAVTHPDPAARAALEEVLREGPDAPPQVAEVVLERGETLRLSGPELEPLESASHLRAFMARFPVHGLLVAPLRTRGRPFGLLAVLRHRSGAGYTDHDRLLVEGVASRAALAIAYARLNASHAAARTRAEQAATRTARLQVVTSRLAGTAGVRDVAAVGAALAIEAAGGVAGGIALIRPGRGDLELHWRRAAADAGDGTVLTRVLDGDGPVQACARSGQPGYHGGEAALLPAHPALAHELERDLPRGALAVLPLRVHGEVAGAMAVRFEAARAFEAEERAFLENLADQCSQALARARLWEREHEWARRQSALADISRALSEAHGDVRRLISAVTTRVGGRAGRALLPVARPRPRPVRAPDGAPPGRRAAARDRGGHGERRPRRPAGGRDVRGGVLRPRTSSPCPGRPGRRCAGCSPATRRAASWPCRSPSTARSGARCPPPATVTRPGSAGRTAGSSTRWPPGWRSRSHRRASGRRSRPSASASRRCSRAPRRRSAPRTSSWPCSRTSCGTRSRPS